MSKFCFNCGNKLDEKAVICVKCGVATCNFQQIRIKQPGRGLSIASMVLGIIAIFYGTCFSLTSIMMNLIDEFYNKEEIIFSIGFNFWSLVLSITGLSLGIASRLKVKNAKNTTGIILNSITILLCILSIIITIITN